MSDTNGQWTFPVIEPGDAILFSRDPSRSDMAFAVVTRVKSDSAIDATAFGEHGPYPVNHLWHKDDPRIRTQADRFHDSVSGVFVLSSREKSYRGLLERMETLEKRFAALERWVAGESDTSESTPRPPVKRGPGRPKKILAEKEIVNG